MAGLRDQPTTLADAVILLGRREGERRDEDWKLGAEFVICDLG